MKTIVTMFDNLRNAQDALQELINNGIARDDISLVASDQEGHYASTLQQDGANDYSGSATAGGAVTGAAVGGIGGVLLGLGALAIPGIGPVIAAGPLLAGLVGAGIGAAVGGLVGALVDAGVPEEQAGYYVEGVRRGGTLLTVTAPENRVDEIVQILNQYDPVNIDERASTWRQSGWTGFDANADTTNYNNSVARTVDQATDRTATMHDIQNTTHTTFTNNFTDDYRAFDSGFRSDYQTRYANSGYTYEEYEPAYRYGYTLANDERYRGRDWDAIEGDARTYWTQNYQDSPWQDFKEAVRHSWQRARDAVAGRN